MSARGQPRHATPGAAGLDPAAGVVLAVDVGGTKFRAALAAPGGVVLAELVEPTAQGPAGAIPGQVVAALATLAARAGVGPGTVRAAGLAVPVAIDPRTGATWSTQNVRGLTGLDLAAAFERALGLPVALDNDGNCAALGEGRAGAAIGVADYAVVVIGTGIGCGVVAGGRLVRGAHGGAGEIAFLPLGADPWNERSRVRGAFETAVSGPAVRARVEAALAAGTSTVLWPGARLADVARAAAAGDALATRLLDEEARLVALGVASLAAVVDPELVVLGGGVGVVAGLLDPVRAHVATLAERPPVVVTGLLGDRAPLVGAIGLALEVAFGGRPGGGPPGATGTP